MWLKKGSRFVLFILTGSTWHLETASAAKGPKTTPEQSREQGASTLHRAGRQAGRQAGSRQKRQAQRHLAPAPALAGVGAWRHSAGGRPAGGGGGRGAAPAAISSGQWCLAHALVPAVALGDAGSSGRSLRVQVHVAAAAVAVAAASAQHESLCAK